ncbi:MAG TPA: carboxypeptidase-like regulatory domain-containing protein [Cyclobacteriaceae bacterium]|nr:carboxypeptidase-like regulatory domain-containing protein [Cyclobacteriaceae bacterium]
MKTSYSISIPKPCSQRWENFTHTSDGGFCGSCNKVVIDFTRMTDEEIIKFLKQKPTHSCGRFKPGQLRSYVELSPPTVHLNFKFLKAGVLSLLLLVIARPSFATKPLTPSPPIVQTINDSLNVEPSLKSDYVVTGTVRSRDDKSELPGVNVLLKGTAYGTVTDEYGKFRFPRRVEDGDVLIFSFIGFIPHEYTIKKTQGDSVNVELKLDYDITGELLVDELYTPKGPPSRYVWGLVSSEEDRSPIPGARVELKGSDIYTSTDADGRFEFPRKLEKGDTLIIKFIGYTKLEIKIPKEMKNILDIRMSFDVGVLGEVAIDGVYEEKDGVRGWWSRLMARF